MYNSEGLYFYYNLTLKYKGENQVNRTLFYHTTFNESKERRPELAVSYLPFILKLFASIIKQFLGFPSGPTLCYAVSIFSETKLGTRSSLPAYHSGRAPCVHSTRKGNCSLLSFCEVKSEWRSLTLRKKFQIIRRHFSGETQRLLAKAGPRSSSSPPPSDRKVKEK